MQIPNTIALHLEKNALTQAAFARIIGVSQPTVAEWVNGNKRPAETALRKVAQALDMSPEALLVEFYLPPA